MTRTDLDRIKTRIIPKLNPTTALGMNKEIQTDKISTKSHKSTRIVHNKPITITIVDNGNNSVLDISIMLLLNTNTTPTWPIICHINRCTKTWNVFIRKKPEKNNNFSMIWKSTFSMSKKLKERKNKISKSITEIFRKRKES